MLANTLPAYFHEFEGDLYDTRRADWTAQPVRRNYAYHHRDIKTGQDLRACLRGGAYAWPGGYELLYLCSDGGCLCSQCVRDNLANIVDSIRSNANDGWQVVAVYTMAECDESQICDHCNREVE